MFEFNVSINTKDNDITREVVVGKVVVHLSLRLIVKGGIHG
jgi:hypothetical protein